jgi:hypothetical protein
MEYMTLPQTSESIASVILMGSYTVLSDTSRTIPSSSVCRRLTVNS